jgi:hypothetical protein
MPFELVIKKPGKAKIKGVSLLRIEWRDKIAFTNQHLFQIHKFEEDQCASDFKTQV